ncbi:MAG: hypothetical protein ABI700_09250 [Chloroflexota bacterium]
MVDINACINNAAPELFGRLALPDEDTLYLLEWRGPLLVKPLQDILGSALLGVIVVVNSSQPECFREACSILRCITELPVVIAANPRNPAEAWSLEHLRIALRLKEQDVLMTCDVTDQRDTVKVVLKLSDALPEDAFIGKLKTLLGSKLDHAG